MVLDVQKVDVAILGGGPCGLATAHSIQRACRHLNVKVYERVPKFSARGAGLRLQVNGVKALQAIDPDLHHKVLNAGYNPRRSLQFSKEGEPRESLWSEQVEKELKEYGHPTCFIGWSDLQQVLAAQVIPGTVQFQAPYERYEIEDDGSVTLFFGSQQPPVRASVVIGCDGYRSLLRQHWLDDGPPEFTGTVIFRGRVPEENWSLGRDSMAFDARNDMVTFVYPGSTGWVVWNGSVAVDVMEQAGVPHQDEVQQGGSTQARGQGSLGGHEIKQRALQLFTEQPEPFRSIIAATSPEVMLEHDNCYRPSWKFPEHALGEGPLTLAGDAAHVIRPTGQGTNQALEDALQLGHTIANHGPTAEALRQYEAVRLPRWKLIASFSEGRALLSYSTSSTTNQLTPAERAQKLQEQERITLGVEFTPLLPSSP